MTTDICEVIVTADNAEWLAGLTRELVEARLIACGQNISTIRSIYRWQGGVEDETEARVAFHTRVDLVPEVIERTKEKHSYDVPCIIVLPVIDGNPEYIDWVRSETQS